MKTNSITSIRFYRGSGNPSMTIYRTNDKRYYQYHGTSADHLTNVREIAIFEGLKASPNWQMEVKFNTVEGVYVPTGFEVVFTPVKADSTTLKMQDKISNQHEILTYAFNFIDSNIDGRLEDWDAADRMWHMLGAVVGNTSYLKGGLGWIRADHRAEFLKNHAGKLAPHIWEMLFDNIIK